MADSFERGDVSWVRMPMRSVVVRNRQSRKKERTFVSKVPSLLIDFKPTTQFDPVKVWFKLKREEQIIDGADAARQVSRRVQEIRERNDGAREKVRH